MTGYGNAARPIHEPAGGGTAATLSLCFITAAMEGFGLQSVGVAARQMAMDFHLSAVAIGWVASASTFGLLPGAIFGGRLADRVGRKRVLVAAVAAFGIFTLATVWSGGYPGLLAARFLTGLGLGATLPTLIALSAEAGKAGTRGRYIGLMYCGVPAGGALASLVSIVGKGPAGWHAIFEVGGALTLVVAVMLLVMLPESTRFTCESSAPPIRAREIAAVTGGFRALFGRGRAPSTLLMWTCLFFHMLVIYVLLNWLPVLLVEKGFAFVQAGVVQIAFNVGGVAGNLVFGWLMDRASRRATAIFMYASVVASLAALDWVASYPVMAALGLAIGLFALGGQMVVYAIVPNYYPILMRGTGVGWAVAIGRLGAFAGPILVGEVLRSGLGPEAVLVGTAPALSVAAMALLALLARPEDDG